MNKKGFTLIELLIVIAIIAILAAIIFVAVDPARRLAEARNAERWSSSNTILNAILKYTTDNGVLPTAVANATSGLYYQIGTDTGNCSATCTEHGTNSSCLNLTTLVDTYIAEMPEDPLTGSGNGTITDYYLRKTSGGRICIGACEPEDVAGADIDIEVCR